METILKICCCVSTDEEVAGVAGKVNTSNQASQQLPLDKSLEMNKDAASNPNPTDFDEFYAVKESPYALPSDECERDRNFLHHKLATYGFGKLFHMPITEGLKAGNFAVLDSGCGPGAWCYEVATKYPKATVIGLDMDETIMQSDLLAAKNLMFTVGRVENLPFKDNTFDAVYQRFISFGIQKDKWIDVIKELKRVTKPGGYIELVEYPFRHYSISPNVEILKNLIQECFEMYGYDVDIGSKFGKYMEREGIEVIETAVHSTPLGWGGRFGELHGNNLKVFFQGIRLFAMKTLSVSDKEYDELVTKALQDCIEYRSFQNVYAVVGRVMK